MYTMKQCEEIARKTPRARGCTDIVHSGKLTYPPSQGNKRVARIVFKNGTGRNYQTVLVYIDMKTGKEQYHE